MIAIVFAYLLLILFFVVDALLRRGEAAKSLEHGESDRGSTMALGRAYAIGGILMLVAPVFDYFQIARMPDWVSGLGLALMVAGLALRIWAMRVLGEYYTRTLRTAERQTLIDRGPYGVVRHPGYLGVLMLWVGAGLATANWIATMLIALVMFVAYRYRIQYEEQMLAATFGEEYRQYAGRTRRLIPFLY
jgi:protein-S-isoprenylcysteine O-methyltransferase Ste14